MFDQFCTCALGGKMQDILVTRTKEIPCKTIVRYYVQKKFDDAVAFVLYCCEQNVIILTTKLCWQWTQCNYARSSLPVDMALRRGVRPSLSTVVHAPTLYTHLIPPLKVKVLPSSNPWKAFIGAVQWAPCVPQQSTPTSAATCRAFSPLSFSSSNSLHDELFPELGVDVFAL